jgi:hypothetical protein
MPPLRQCGPLPGGWWRGRNPGGLVWFHPRPAGGGHCVSHRSRRAQRLQMTLQMLQVALGLTTALGPAPRAAGPRAHPSPPKRMHECSILIAAMLRRWPRSRMARADEGADHRARAAGRLRAFATARSTFANPRLQRRRHIVNPSRGRGDVESALASHREKSAERVP